MKITKQIIVENDNSHFKIRTIIDSNNKPAKSELQMFGIDSEGKKYLKGTLKNLTQRDLLGITDFLSNHRVYVKENTDE